MQRRLRPAAVSTAIPALASMFAAVVSTGCDPALAQSPPPHDAGRPTHPHVPLPPPIVPLGGAPVAVRPGPPVSAPSPPAAPSPSPPGFSSAPRAAPALPPGVAIVHNHPPGAPCHPIAQADLDNVARQSRVTR